jgi:hypothetical protein
MHQRMYRQLAGVLVVISVGALSACSGTPTAPAATPTPTPTSITVASANTHLFLGQAETFTATLTMSDGTTQPLTGGTWGTDAAGVATAGATTGLVTSVGSGDVTVFVDAQGIRGTKRIRVVPEYQGIWTGTYTVDTCTHSGQWAVDDACGILTAPVGSVVGFNLTQTGATVAGQSTLGIFSSTPFTVAAATTGDLSFSTAAQWVTTTIAQEWSLRITTIGRLDGTVTHTWTDPTMTGSVIVKGTLNGLTRGGSAPDRANAAHVHTRRDFANAVLGRRQ